MDFSASRKQIVFLDLLASLQGSDYIFSAMGVRRIVSEDSRYSFELFCSCWTQALLFSASLLNSSAVLYSSAKLLLRKF